MALRDTELAWEGCLNVRDLGGHRTEDGGETSYGAIVRADSVHQLTEAGWEALVAYGIRTVVDLRGHHEREGDPPSELPVEVVHVPAMLGVLAELERRYRSVDGFLLSAGASQDELALARARLRG